MVRYTSNHSHGDAPRTTTSQLKTRISSASISLSNSITKFLKTGETSIIGLVAKLKKITYQDDPPKFYRIPTLDDQNSEFEGLNRFYEDEAWEPIPDFEPEQFEDFKARFYSEHDNRVIYIHCPKWERHILINMLDNDRSKFNFRGDLLGFPEIMSWYLVKRAITEEELKKVLRRFPVNSRLTEFNNFNL